METTRWKNGDWEGAGKNIERSEFLEREEKRMAGNHSGQGAVRARWQNRRDKILRAQGASAGSVNVRGGRGGQAHRRPRG